MIRGSLMTWILISGMDSINMVLTREGRPSGEAYIEMASEDDIEKALKKDRQNMGKRYVEGSSA